MAGTLGRNSSSVIENLVREPYRFDFFQAVRILERLRRNDEPPVAVGYDGPMEQEAVRFVAPLSMSFPSAAIRELVPRGPGQPFEFAMHVSFMGLTGPSGTLPRHYSTLLIERTREKETAYRDFLDLFNHRLVSLFYRAWEKYRIPAAYERAATTRSSATNSDLFTFGLYSLVGMGTDGLRGRTAVPDETFLYYGGLFACQSRSPAGIVNIVSSYFNVMASVESFVGQWLSLPPEERSSLPAKRNPKGLNCRLGVDAILGTKVWDVQSRFRVRLGPLSYRQFCEFLPSGNGFNSIFDLLRTYAGPCLDSEIQPVLLAKEVPFTQLLADAPVKPRLGQNVWMASRPFEHDFDGAVFASPN
jgi:type VI secretion system protein ImpH